ncbi:MAG TPA: Pvc16 family protein [Mycobacterium sp.]
MLDQVDELIRAVLMRDVAGLVSADQVGFQPPDDDWRKTVANLGRSAVSVYLVDLRENRALRDPSWRLEFHAGQPRRRPGLLRVDCHYLISAWSPAAHTPAVDATLEEHAVLYGVMAALARANPLNPSRVYPPGSTVVDELIRDADLPVQVVSADGWPKLTEFWGTMGTNSRAKPAIWYTVTVPVDMPHQVAGPLVATRIIEFRQGSDPASAEQLLQIGGTVTRGGVPVEDAVVTVTGSAGRVVGSASTGADGRFSVSALSADSYTLHAEKPSAGSADTTAVVPGGTGDYDMSLT